MHGNDVLPPASVALRDTCDSYASRRKISLLACRPDRSPFWGIFGREVVRHGAERRSGLGDDLLDQLAQVLVTTRPAGLLVLLLVGRSCATGAGAHRRKDLVADRERLRAPISRSLSKIDR